MEDQATGIKYSEKMKNDIIPIFSSNVYIKTEHDNKTYSENYVEDPFVNITKHNVNNIKVEAEMDIIDIKDEPVEETNWKDEPDSPLSADESIELKSSLNLCTEKYKDITGLDVLNESTSNDDKTRVIPEALENLFSITDFWQKNLATLAESTGRKADGTLYECHICSCNYTFKVNLLKHMQMHEKLDKLEIDTSEKYTCNICNKKYEDKTTLNRHIKIHTRTKLYKCTICEKEFVTRTNLNMHMRIHTGEKVYKCAVCSRQFYASSHLTVHMRTHTGEKPYECQLCRRKFADKSSLNAHTRAHSGIKPFECETCHKKFSSRSHLNTHSVVHTGARFYECDVCNKKFNVSSNLLAHKRIHSGDKSHVCSVCGKGFTQSGSLTIHLRTHTGEKPFTCETCGKCFNNKGRVKAHSLIHTKAKGKKNKGEWQPGLVKTEVPDDMVITRKMNDKNHSEEKISIQEEILEVMRSLKNEPPDEPGGLSSQFSDLVKKDLFIC